jgi:hypothetical protein
MTMSASMFLRRIYTPATIPAEQIAALTRIVMKTIILPSGNAFGADDIDGFTG